MCWLWGRAHSAACLPDRCTDRCTAVGRWLCWTDSRDCHEPLTLPQGATVDKGTFTTLSAQGVPTASGTLQLAPAPAPAAAPSPAASPVPASPAQPAGGAAAVPPSASASKSNLPAILGGAIGGGVGGLLLIALAVVVLRRRRAGRQGGAAMQANFNPAYGATASIGGAAPRKGADLTEVVQQSGTPTSAKRRAAATPF